MEIVYNVNPLTFYINKHVKLLVHFTLTIQIEFAKNLVHPIQLSKV